MDLLVWALLVPNRRVTSREVGGGKNWVLQLTSYDPLDGKVAVSPNAESKGCFLFEMP